jgi:hypothetical protein
MITQWDLTTGTRPLLGRSALLLATLATLIFLLYKPIVMIENFFTLKNKSINLDLPEIFSILTTNVISKSPTGIPNLIGFPVKKNIIATYATGLPVVKYIIDKTLTKLNNHSSEGIKWKLLELIKFDIKLISFGKTRYFIELFLVYSDTPIQVVIDLDYKEHSKSIRYNQVILMNKIKEFENAYDPTLKDSFEINNSLGLLPPFKSSNTLILSDKIFEIDSN